MKQKIMNNSQDNLGKISIELRVTVIVQMGVFKEVVMGIYSNSCYSSNSYNNNSSKYIQNLHFLIFLNRILRAVLLGKVSMVLIVI